jgi:hypothetical protein
VQVEEGASTLQELQDGGQSSDSTVTLSERMQRFELAVSESSPQRDGQSIIGLIHAATLPDQR